MANVRFQMAMSGRVVFKTRVFDTMEEESHFTPVPAAMAYQKAIEMLLRKPLSDGGNRHTKSGRIARGRLLLMSHEKSYDTS